MKAISRNVLRAEWPWLLLFLVTLGVVPRIWGAEKALTHPDQVTVFPEGARVTREGTLKLSPGIHQILFTDLPASVIESSLRLTVEGPHGTKLYGVSLRNEFTSEVVESRTRRLRIKLQGLEDQK